MKKLKNLWSKLSLLPEYLQAITSNAFKRLPKGNPVAVFKLDALRLYTDLDGSGRLAYMTLRNFAEGGYNVYLLKGNDFLTYTRLGRYGRYLYSLKNLKVISRPPADTSAMVFAFDTFDKDLLDLSWKRVVFINILKSPSAILGETISLPYGMHPIMYQERQTDKLTELRKNTRKLRIFFGGNTLSSYYSNPKLSTLYGQLTRKEALEAVEGLDKVRVLADLNELSSIINGEEYIKEARILKKNETAVYGDKWLDILSRCEFFICFSGTDLPMCHHTVESMSVGVIPIISYHDWFTPALEHKKNAIIYSGKEDLLNKIKDVLAMDPAEITRMRDNVIKYYDTIFTPRNFVQRFDSQKGKHSTLLLYPKYKPSEWEIKEHAPLYAALKSYFRDFKN